MPLIMTVLVAFLTSLLVFSLGVGDGLCLGDGGATYKCSHLICLKKQKESE